MTENLPAGKFVDVERLPSQFPTHRHDPAFWESLGRAVASFGFLEDVLGRAIFAFTGMRPVDPTAIERGLSDWQSKLERALSDPLGRLISAYGKAVGEHGSDKVPQLDGLLADLRKSAEMRNILCHASWEAPDAHGASVPRFVTPDLRITDTAIDVAFIEQVQRHTAELACAVLNTVTAMGWQFPGSTSPGKALWP